MTYIVVGNVVAVASSAAAELESCAAESGRDLEAWLSFQDLPDLLERRRRHVRRRTDEVRRRQEHLADPGCEACRGPWSDRQHQDAPFRQDALP